MTKALTQVSRRLVWWAILGCVLGQGAHAQWPMNTFPPPSPGASSCSATGANWLICTISGGTLTLGAAAGQASHQVIGTCGTATSFAPCSLTSAELPLSSMGTVTGGTWIGTAIARAYGGLNSTTAGTGILRDGTTPTASEISGDCTTSGSNAITCTKTNGTSFAPSATTDTTNAANIATGTLGTGRLPNSTGYAVIAGNGGASTVTSGATVYYGAGVATSSGTEITRSTVSPSPVLCAASF